jgi:hypothetical protein
MPENTTSRSRTFIISRKPQSNYKINEASRGNLEEQLIPDFIHFSNQDCNLRMEIIIKKKKIISIAKLIHNFIQSSYFTLT